MEIKEGGNTGSDSLLNDAVSNSAKLYSEDLKSLQMDRNAEVHKSSKNLAAT
jgi:hypothetical protein